jgi:hypothetical protein
MVPRDSWILNIITNKMYIASVPYQHFLILATKR